MIRDSSSTSFVRMQYAPLFCSLRSPASAAGEGEHGLAFTPLSPGLSGCLAPLSLVLTAPKEAHIQGLWLSLTRWTKGESSLHPLVHPDRANHNLALWVVHRQGCVDRSRHPNICIKWHSHFICRKQPSSFSAGQSTEMIVSPEIITNTH